MSVDIFFFAPKIITEEHEGMTCHNCHAEKTENEVLIRIPGEVDFDFCRLCFAALIQQWSEVLACSRMVVFEPNIPAEYETTFSKPASVRLISEPVGAGEHAVIEVECDPSFKPSKLVVDSEHAQSFVIEMIALQDGRLVVSVSNRCAPAQFHEPRMQWKRVFGIPVWPDLQAYSAETSAAVVRYQRALSEEPKIFSATMHGSIAK